MWDGKIIYSRVPPVAWDKMCMGKHEGGLRIKDCGKWNQAAIGKLVWDIASKADKMWVKWINHYYVKDTNWWEYEPKGDTSWSRRKICKIKTVMADAYDRDKWKQSTIEWGIHC